MYVGVILLGLATDDTSQGIPHVCGGDPESELKNAITHLYSPCMWG